MAGAVFFPNAMTAGPEDALSLRALGVGRRTGRALGRPNMGAARPATPQCRPLSLCGVSLSTMANFRSPLLPLAMAASLLTTVSPLPTPISTVVVLVLENRSFDHMLGWLRRPDVDGLTGRECNPVDSNGTICVSDDAQYVALDPGHSFQDVLEQVFGAGAGGDGRRVPSMSGFVKSAISISASLQRTVMRCFKPESVPVFTSLTREFAVFDRWFSSIPGPTQPNRLFVYSATSHGAVAHDKLSLLRGYPQRTIFDSLHDDGRTFGIYFKNLPTTLFYRNLRRIKYVGNFHLYGQFKRHAAAGSLPNFSVIEPRYFDVVGFPADDDHPAHDVANGQRLVKDVYEALRASPQWNSSLLIVTYDEHGGFFDHVATPCSGVPSPDGIPGPAPYYFGFDRLGVRVPTIMVSPWIKKGTVARSPAGPTETSEYEHSSIPATMKKLFNLSSGFLTRRDAWAGTFEHLFAELDEPRTDCPEALPPVAPLRTEQPEEDGGLSEFQGELVELAAALNGDYFLSSSSEEARSRMTVKQADAYLQRAAESFLEASRRAAALGANESAVVSMKPSLHRRQPSPLLD